MRTARRLHAPTLRVARRHVVVRTGAVRLDLSEPAYAFALGVAAAIASALAVLLVAAILR